MLSVGDAENENSEGHKQVDVDVKSRCDEAKIAILFSLLHIPKPE